MELNAFTLRPDLITAGSEARVADDDASEKLSLISRLDHNAPEHGEGHSGFD